MLEVEGSGRRCAIKGDGKESNWKRDGQFDGKASTSFHMDPGAAVTRAQSAGELRRGTRSVGELPVRAAPGAGSPIGGRTPP